MPHTQMTPRQRLIKVLIEEKQKFIVENFATLDAIRMDKEARAINNLKNKLPNGLQKNL